MLYYRVALRGSQSATWRWKSSPLTSLDGVLGVLNLYRCVPREYIRLSLSTSPDQMDAMLSRANQGLLSTAITIDQLYDKHAVGWIEVRRLELASLDSARSRPDEAASQARARCTRVVGSSSALSSAGNVCVKKPSPLASS